MTWYGYSVDFNTIYTVTCHVKNYIRRNQAGMAMPSDFGLILPFALMGVFLTFRIAISVRLNYTFIGRVHGDLPSQFSHPLPCSVSNTGLICLLQTLTNVFGCFEVRTLILPFASMGISLHQSFRNFCQAGS